MKYTKDDIDWRKITPKAFENLCYDLLVNYNFNNLIWRQGGADNGRDIEGNYLFKNSIKDIKTKWFFECKHYTSNGVSPDELNAKIAWADAEKPDYLVILVSSYITTNARTWLEKLSLSKQYHIIVIEGEELKDRLVKYPDLIERYFALDRYDKLFKEMKDLQLKFKISPSFEVLREIINNIDFSKLDIEDISFLLLNFYGQYTFFDGNEYDYFDDTIIFKFLDFLKDSITHSKLSSFSKYKDNYDALGGDGMFEEIFYNSEDMKFNKFYNFQSYTFHLNYKKEREYWSIGEYLFIIYKDVAFELFKDEITEIRIIQNFVPESLLSLSIKLPKSIVEEYNNYVAYFKDKE